jgi:hypothetical protein
MDLNELMTAYFWCLGVYSFGSIAWLAFRHRVWMRTSVLRAMNRKQVDGISAELESRWNRDVRIVSRISIALLVGWMALIFFGRALVS